MKINPEAWEEVRSWFDSPYKQSTDNRMMSRLLNMPFKNEKDLAFTTAKLSLLQPHPCSSQIRKLYNHSKFITVFSHFTYMSSLDTDPDYLPT